MPKNAICDGKQDCRDNSDEKNCQKFESFCSFDEGICDWDMEGDVFWKITHEGTPSSYTGPWRSREQEEEPVEPETNRYLYLEATNANEGESARLCSPGKVIKKVFDSKEFSIVNCLRTF